MVKKKVDSYDHQGEKRINNPPVGLVSSATDKLNGRTEYAHDPHIDPFLSWAGKKEKSKFEIQNVSLHIHERIDANRIMKSFLKKETEKQDSLFEGDYNQPPLNKAMQFYQHEQDWTNRLVSGDSLLVMNSLLHKEGMAGKVQMIYIDPPYGIKYNSNFQPFINKKNVGDKDDDIPAEPEMIRAFRDTWELGIHSYLTHMRDRLLLAKELLHESGSVFVQINDENLHFVKSVMEEIMGAKNKIAIIPFRTKKMPLSLKTLDSICDYIVWYAKDKDSIKYRQLFEEKKAGDGHYTSIEDEDGTIRKITDDDNIEELKSRLFLPLNMNSSGLTPSCVFEVNFQGKTYIPRSGHSWMTNKEGMQKLIKIGRIFASEKVLYYKLYHRDFPVKNLTNMWSDTMGAFNKRYVVETSGKVIQRCLLMTTDSGDLVLDPTCGSGTTAYVAEQWGRRWITCDTSRVALALAKQRLMTAKFDYYQLANLSDGVKSGFNCKTVPHVTLGSIAKDESSKQETLHDQPIIDNKKVRVTGPFTVEAVPSLRVKPYDSNMPKTDGNGRELSQTGETGRQTLYRDKLKTTGIRATGGDKIEFSIVEPMPGTRFLHAKGDITQDDGTTKKAYISFGPDFGPLEQRQVEEAAKEAIKLKEKADFIIFAAFHFDPEASKDIDQMKMDGVQILKAQMSVDLLTEDLRKKTREDQSYWLIGQPDVDVLKEEDGKYKVRINGFDYYNPLSGMVESKSNKDIAMWFLDTDYDERSLFPEQVFFPMKDSKRDWTKLSKALNGDVNQELIEAFTGIESLSFSAGDEKKIAVKIIDSRGIESFVVKPLK